MVVFLGVMLCGATPGQEDVSRKLHGGRSLEKQGRLEEAVKLYEELYRSYPRDQRVLRSLSNAYLAAQSYDKLIEVCQVSLKSDPENPTTLRYLGQAYFGKGEKRKGIEIAGRIVELDPKDRRSYYSAASLLISANLVDEAVDLYLRGRKDLGDESLFTRELAFAHQRKGDYGNATTELLSLLRANPRQAVWVEREIRSMLKRGGSSEIIGVLKKQTEKEAPPQFHTILGDIYLSQGKYEAAAGQYEKSGGVDALLELGRMAEGEKLFNTALTTYRRVLEASQDEKVKAEASLRIGASLRSLGRFEDALKAFDWAASQYPSVGGEAVYQAGRVWLDDLKEPKKAAPEFEEVLGRRGEARAADAALSLVKCYLSVGDLGRAERTCERLSTLRPDQATFLLAETQYYKGEFDRALELYGEVVEKHKEQEVTNDALERILLVGESEREDLRDFAQAEFLGLQGKHDEGVDLLRKLIGRRPSSSLAPGATFLIGDLLRGKGEAHQAIGAYRDVMENYPESPLCPYAKMEIGEIYLTELKNREKGIEELEALLIEYPNSVLSDLVRERIDELRGL